MATELPFIPLQLRNTKSGLNAIREAIPTVKSASAVCVLLFPVIISLNFPPSEVDIEALVHPGNPFSRVIKSNIPHMNIDTPNRPSKILNLVRE